jgi:peptide/nickel transport system permease protein
MDRKNISRRGSLVWLCLLVVAGLVLPAFKEFDPLVINLPNALSPPTLHHLAGTDELGRDVLTRTLAASETSLLIGICTSVIAVSLGTILGILAGFLGGVFGLAAGIAVDFTWSVPNLVLVMLAASVLGVSFVSLIVIMAVLTWVTSARIVRERVIALLSQPYLRTAHAYGFGNVQIVFRQILPNLKSLVLVLLAYGTAEVIFLESGLAFLGLGIPVPRPTWGGMITEGLDYFSPAYWLVLVPALTLVITLYSFQTIARSYEERTRYSLHA